MGPRYRALALQTRCDAVNECADRAAARARMRASLARIAREVAAAKAFIGLDLALVVLPEYVLTGYPLGDAVAEWADKTALAADGPEYDALAGIASDNALFLA
ncbi:MAG: nitrilase, partial [Alphaproteobacteria bacterium]